MFRHAFRFSHKVEAYNHYHTRASSEAASEVPIPLLPLFPLDLVLLPTAPLPLHIFEPRYKEMITECLDTSKPFGVLRAAEAGIADVGCTAEITNVIKKYPDGRMDIVTLGRQRFEVLQVNQERSFLQGEVLYIEDEAQPSSTDEREQALKLHDEIMSLVGAVADHSSEIDEQQLSFHLAGSLPLEADFKQQLLGMKSESERLQAIISFFTNILPAMRRSIEVRRKAGGNGHAG